MKIYQRTIIQRIEVAEEPEDEPIAFVVREAETKKVIQTFHTHFELERWLSTWNYIRQV